MIFTRLHCMFFECDRVSFSKNKVPVQYEYVDPHCSLQPIQKIIEEGLQPAFSNFKIYPGIHKLKKIHNI